MSERASESVDRRGWRIGIATVVIAAFAGLGLGVVIDRATGATPERESVPARLSCNPNGPAGCPNTSKVRTAREGVRKFRAGKLGHLPKNVHYTARTRDIITDKLMRKQASLRELRQVGKLVPGGYPKRLALTRGAMWAKFTRNDSCSVTYRGFKNPYATCRTIPTDGPLPRSTVHAMFCGAGAGIVIAAAVPTGPLGWFLVGSGTAICLFQEAIESQFPERALPHRPIDEGVGSVV